MARHVSRGRQKEQFHVHSLDLITRAFGRFEVKGYEGGDRAERN